MNETTPKKGKKQSPRQQRNRYMRHAKISEYRFLKVLRGFVDEKTVQDTAASAKLSEKRTRELYDELRGKLMRAVMLQPFEFGWAGYFLFDNLALSTRGQHIIDVIAASNLMRGALNRHAPRSGVTVEPSQRFSELVFEVTVRVFCALSMRKDNETLYSDDIHEAYEKLQMIALYIQQQKDNPDDPEQYVAIALSFRAIMKDFPVLLAQEEFKSLVEGYDRHHFPNELLFNDLKRYLLADPIG